MQTGVDVKKLENFTINLVLIFPQARKLRKAHLKKQKFVPQLPFSEHAQNCHFLTDYCQQIFTIHPKLNIESLDRSSLLVLRELHFALFYTYYDNYK